MTAPLTIWWVRHGPTHQKSFCGWRDVDADLSDTGLIERIGAGLPTDAAVGSSDLRRAMQTADAIAGARARLDPMPQIREFNFGQWDGLGFDEVAARDPETSRLYWETPGDVAPPGGESWNQLSRPVHVEGFKAANLGGRVEDVWGGEPEGVYVPTAAKAEMVCTSDEAEVFVAGARYDKVLDAFAVRSDELDLVQYGSDDTKTHRKIKHILGQKQHDKVGRLLVSELFTVGEGGWSGFPSHKHDTDRLPIETRHDETYNFRFKPNHGSGVQMLQREDGKPGDAYHLVDGSTICLDSGYHPCCVLPGYQMYYFTILGGLTQRSLVQFFQPSHAYQIETIPGIKDMIAKFK